MIPRKKGTRELLPEALHRCRRCGWRLPLALVRLVYLFFWRRFSLREILYQDLLTAHWSFADLSQTLSKEESVRALGRINPKGYRNLTEDKWVFWEQASRHGLPVPRVLARLERDGTLFPQGTRGVDGFVNFIKSLRTDGLVIKAVNGSDGEEVFVFDCVDSALRAHSGRLRDSAELYHELLGLGFSFLLQERLRSHPELVTLTGSQALQCLRLVTCLDGAGRVHLIIRKLRLGGPSSAVDNFGGGAPGAALCILSEDGRVERVIFYDDVVGHLVSGVRLPTNGNLLVGYEIPFWDAAVAVVKRAALAFAPLRCIGWDVALSDAGPSLIEGNVFWNPTSPLEAPMQPMWRRIETLTTAEEKSPLPAQ